MSEMVDRVARALWADVFKNTEHPPEWTFDSEDAGLQDVYREQARAAIEAMVPATDGMIEAGAIAGVDQIYYKSNAWNRCVDDEFKPDHLNFSKFAWRAMIDTALK